MLQVGIEADRCYIGLTPSAGALAARRKEDDELSHHANAVHDTTAAGLPMTELPIEATSEEVLARILECLSENKAEDIVTIDLRGKSAMADQMVICSGRSTRQVISIAEKLTDTLKQEFGRASKSEGKDQGDWVLIDTGDVIVHVFRPEVREFYQLEKMWMPAGAATARA